MHPLSAESPIRAWADEGPFAAASGSEILVTAEGYHLGRKGMVVRRRTYRVPDDVVWGHRFPPMVVEGRKGELVSASATS